MKSHNYVDTDVGDGCSLAGKKSHCKKCPFVKCIYDMFDDFTEEFATVMSKEATQCPKCKLFYTKLNPEQKCPRCGE